MLDIVFGPDGVGKSRLVEQLQTVKEAPIVLHGTDVRSWFSKYADILGDHGFNASQIPPDREFEAKIELVNAAALALAEDGHSVIIDGHALYQTVINVAAGQLAIPGAERGTPVRTLVEQRGGHILVSW